MPRGCREGCPPPHGKWGAGEGLWIFELKKASFSAFWVLFNAVELNGNWLRPVIQWYAMTGEF